MKLYTEEQVRNAIADACADAWDNSFKVDATKILNQLTPIELPSDEYIDEVFQPMTELNAFYKDGFINGAKWMKEQILNQNK